MRSSGALKFPFCGRAETCTKLRSVFLSEEPERTLSCFVETTFVAFAIEKSQYLSPCLPSVIRLVAVRRIGEGQTKKHAPNGTAKQTDQSAPCNWFYRAPPSEVNHLAFGVLYQCSVLR